MWRPSLQVRPDERKETRVAFFTLMGFVGSHTTLETARDALFLAKVPASHLPWVFIAIAIVSMVLTRLQQRFSHRLAGRAALSAWIAFAGTVTLAFWGLMPLLGSAGVYALYVWSGVLTTLVLVHFWTLLGTLFSLTQAKRLYGVIGAGSVAGALAGSGTAGALATVVEARHLVLAAGLGFVATAWLPFNFTKTAVPTPLDSRDAKTGVLGSAQFIYRDPYARNVVALTILGTATLTLADFLFKGTLASHVPPEDLGTYFGSISFVLNIVSFAVQLALVSALIRRLGVSGSLTVLPFLIVAGAVGLLATGGLIAAIAIKAADGSFRYSLHRTASELLFLPLADEARRKTKAFNEVVAQRGGQALMAVAILVLAATAAPSYVLAVLLIAFGLLWMWSAIQLQSPYLQLFRGRLVGRRVKLDADKLGLDVASLETLVRALDSQHDGDVLAALDVLEHEGKVRLVPALILYHPSEPVVERALELFTHANRTNVVPIIDRLVEHPSARIRAACLAARSVLDPDARPLLMRLSFEESPEVRAAIVVNLIVLGEIIGSDAKDRMDSLLRHGTLATKIALAEAISRRAAQGFDDVLMTLVKSSDPTLRLAALHAIGRVKPTNCLPILIDMLGEEAMRGEAQRVLVDYGIAGFKALVAAIEDESLPRGCRTRIPHAIGPFDPDLAAAVLLEWMTREKDGAVRYQIGRVLERLIERAPALVLDEQLLDKTISSTVSRAYRYLDRRLALARAVAQDPTRDTPGLKLLIALLKDKETNLIERLFGLIGLAYRSDDFTDIYRGLTSSRKDARATSVELIENILRPPLRQAVLGLIDDLPDNARLESAGEYHTPQRFDYDGVLQNMLASTSESIQDLTVFHIGELRLTRFESRVAILPHADTRADVQRTLELLRQARSNQREVG
jgi:ATP:ADP antiporter, AAA family